MEAKGWETGAMRCDAEMDQDGELMEINPDERSISFQLMQSSFEMMRGHTLTLSAASKR
jgi:hypothetical protein